MKGRERRRRLVSSVVIATFVSLIMFPIGGSDLESDRAVLLAFRASVGGRPLLVWNTSDPSPCSWVGVTCGQNGVYELRLPGVGLSGRLPLGLGNLTQLQTLSLRVNTLSGPLPSDFANLNALRNLYLQGNSFSGDIPGFLFTMQNLVRLNMGNNQFSGEIPSDFNKLTRLATLYLENNNFTGPIPDLDIPSLAQFNVSFNQLNGSVPLKLTGMPASAFEGNSLCGAPLDPCNGTSSKNRTGNKIPNGAIVGIVIGSFIVFLLIILTLICLCLRKRRNQSRSKNNASGEVEAVAGGSENMSLEQSMAEKGGVRGGGGRGGSNKGMVFLGKGGKVFDLEDLLKASAEVLGKGTFGTTYKATMEEGMEVAVKRVKEVSVTEKEFKEKIEEVGKMSHENLVALRSYYCSKDETLLTYDFLPMGSLSALLHGSREAGRTPLNWEARSGIALGAARGITYIHSQSGSINSHGNIKSSNILLTTSYEPRVTDFGLAQFANPSSAPNRIAGYRAPEVTDTHKVSHKADVYSFGVLLLELLTGKPPTYSLLNEEGVDLPRWVQSVVQEEWTAEVFDVELLRYQNVEDEMVQVLELALQCTASYPDNRPAMAEVTSRIEDLYRSSLRKFQVIETNNDKSPRLNSADSALPIS